MVNLEELILNLVIENEDKFFDGNDLKKTIINYMPQLHQLAFNIRSMVELNNFLHFPTNEAIQCNGWAIKNVTICILVISHSFFVLTNKFFPQNIPRFTLDKIVYT